MAINPVAWFEIYVQDMERAKQFYESVFQLELRELSPPFSGIELWGFPCEQQSYGATGALVKLEGCSSGGNSTIIYFHCEDCGVEEARAKKHGGRVHREKMSIGEYGFISLVMDTEGNMIGLHSM
ncbi:VOC family protein [Methylomonas sp. MED-D]|uniref:VOC family protein n=1 Tax=unclassified Methylomonas TaxID=2608980 RepID=UPI0028A3288C|nr:VOC family protein [Methylomonas sp. MV1]MDT4330817.1 VOC family protein [Methylomonas sp. MV1]